ncbi:hypothetical protein DL766_003243 [Monosporascus sp. MC13-8B]|uniref:Major facilitator superfamily (MFS) profile domain-containing protein n=1 Tax=Monosporascus cannonballus TaxID=155416 RepID=A0ABY0HJY4_9PEZI|nr:hypothetical protein DL762_001320 [Monosporascus cannonballus]RYP01647.1 hypothetical protein DL763_000036 [Monosporascus cannonballus]RYP33874.1 hypothetical protein DL766_003243 [Monosporascus sp. MC13-8B]
MCDIEKTSLRGFSPAGAQTSPRSVLPPDLDVHLTLEERLNILCVLYILAFLDRINIGNAKIAGLAHDTNLTGDQFEISLSIFFIPYSLCSRVLPSDLASFEPLTNVLLKKWRPSLFIPTIIELAAARWLLGLAEFDDRARVIHRLKLNQQSSAGHEECKMDYLVMALKDWKTWFGMFVYTGCLMPIYAFTIFLPSIVQGLGIGADVIRVQLLTVPPYAVGALLTVLVGYFQIGPERAILSGGPRGRDGIPDRLPLRWQSADDDATRAENKKRRGGERDYLFEGKGPQEIECLETSDPIPIIRSRLNTG